MKTTSKATDKGCGLWLDNGSYVLQWFTPRGHHPHRRIAWRLGPVSGNVAQCVRSLIIRLRAAKEAATRDDDAEDWVRRLPGTARRRIIRSGIIGQEWTAALEQKLIELYPKWGRERCAEYLLISSASVKNKVAELERRGIDIKMPKARRDYLLTCARKNKDRRSCPISVFNDAQSIEAWADSLTPEAIRGQRTS